MEGDGLKIALVGSAPSSVRIGPYANPEWHVWGCSPGAWPVVGSRANIWFELHRWEPGQPWMSEEYCKFLRDFPGVVFMAEKRPEVPNSEVLPIDELTAKYGPYFWTSSLSYMLAMAIEMNPQKIGLWGVDMAANEEYEAQRSGCHYFAQIARQRGIEIGTPPESDLFRPRLRYGIDEITHGSIKMMTRKRELEHRLGLAQQQMEQCKQEVGFVSGALDDMNYMKQTWLDNGNWTSPPLVTVPFHATEDGLRHLALTPDGDPKAPGFGEARIKAPSPAWKKSPGKKAKLNASKPPR